MTDRQRQQIARLPGRLQPTPAPCAVPPTRVWPGLRLNPRGSMAA